MERVLITGASNGIGEMIARKFGARGYDLVLVARSGDKLYKIKNDLIDTYKIKVDIIMMDLTSENAPQSLYSQIQSRNLIVDILVNNAGFGDHGDYLDISWDRQKNMVMLNILTLMELTYLFGNDMKKRGKGRILNVASIAGFGPGPYMSVYYASKAFVVSFSESIAQEMKKDGITLTCLCPGPTDTNFMTEAHLGDSPMFKVFKPNTASNVAEVGVKALLKGKTLVVDSISGHLLNLATRFVPRQWVAYVTAYVNGKR